MEQPNPQPENPISQESHPPTPETPPHNPLFAGGVVMLAAAVLLLMCGMCSALLYLVLPLATENPTDQVGTNIIFGSMAGIGILFGALWVWQGVVTVRGEEPRRAARVFPPTLVLVIIFFFAILAGLLAQAITPLAPYIFPPWHFLATALPPLAFVSFAARRLGIHSGIRALTTAFGWGALGATFVALVLELGIVVALVFVFAVVLSLAPGGPALINQLQSELARGRMLNDPQAIVRLLSDPKVIVIALVYFAVIVPILEEAVKTLVLAWINPQRTHLADALLWGISAGAGFSVVESMLNANPGVSAWAVMILMRVGATTIHVANGATMGRGWYAARVERRWGRLAVAYGVSVLLHALWNASAIILSGSALFVSENPGMTWDKLLPTSGLILALLAILLALTLLGITWIVYSVRTVALQT